MKIADDQWSLTELERALRDQLAGQYLRHAACKAGCLLLTHDGSRSHWRHPATGARPSFGGMVGHLTTVAEEVERRLAHEVRLAVRGLDLTDPVLPPVHR